MLQNQVDNQYNMHNMQKNPARKESIFRPTTNQSMTTTFRGARRSSRQYYSLKKNHSVFSETSYSSRSPSRKGESRAQKASLSPDRKSMYWQNWLLPEEIRKPINFQKPTFHSSSICSIYSDNNQVFLAENSHEQRQIASLTKIMTAFTVIHICNSYSVKIREVWVPISKEAALMEGTSANLRYGEDLLVIDLLYGLMLPSGNDAAIALAMFFGKFLSYTFANEQLFDGEDDEGKHLAKFSAQKDFYDAEYNQESIELFVFEMNKNCQKIGLKKTMFTNPTGLSDGKSFSTAHDVCLLISFCMRNHLLRSIFKKKVYTCESRNLKMASIRNIEWKNTNRHLFLLKDCIGVKTGITPGAGPCLSAAYRVIGRQLIVVTLNSNSLEDRYTDSEKVYRHAKKKLQNQHQENQLKEWVSPPKRSMELNSERSGIGFSK